MSPTVTAPLEADTELIDLADAVLRENGYLVSPLVIDDLPYLMAENQDNIVLLTATFTVQDLLAAEPQLTRSLSRRLREAPVDAKKWDGYVVLLAREGAADDAATEALFSLTYNLRQVRKFVYVRVEPKKAAVERRLRPVLPLTDVPIDLAVEEPIRALERRLVDDGLDESAVMEAVLAFRAQAPSPGRYSTDTEDSETLDEADEHDV